MYVLHTYVGTVLLLLLLLLLHTRQKHFTSKLPQSLDSIPTLRLEELFDQSYLEDSPCI
jgi:hypothetical protein